MPRYSQPQSLQSAISGFWPCRTISNQLDSPDMPESPALVNRKPNPHWARLPVFNRKNWSRFRFGDVVENVNERVEPGTAAESIYGFFRNSLGNLHWLG